MFLLPFLKYLKPFKWRMAVAILGMVIVSSLGAANLLILQYPLGILIDPKGEILGSLTGETGKPGAEPGDKAGKAEKPKKAKFRVGDLLPAGVVRWWEESGPKPLIEKKTAALKAWYAEKASRNPFTALSLICGLMLGLTLLKCVSEYVAQFQMAYAFYFINAKMKEDIYANVLRQDYQYFSDKSPGLLSSRISSDVQAIKQIIDKMLSDGIQQPLNILMYAVVLLYLSPRLTLIVAMLAPPIAFLLHKFGKELRENTRAQKQKSDEMAGTMAEGLYNIRLVKSFGSEATEIQKFVHRSQTLFKFVMARRVAKFASGPIMEFIGTVAACGVVLLGGYMILGDGAKWGGNITPQVFLLYLFTLTRFYRPVKGLSNTTMRYQTAKVSAERIGEMLGLRPSVADCANPRPFQKLETGLEFRNVTFRYDEEEVLKGVSLAIPKGSTVAFVGRTGAGKTTLVNLVPRLMDPSEGEILLDGVDLKEYRISDLRRRMGIVTQQTLLFDDTVANNIAYASDDPSIPAEERMGRIKAAARAAHAEEFIERMDGGLGYDTEIGPSGMKLSGGQAQRIAIARALFRDPEILIFDEATSSLDAKVQAQVQDAINTLIKGRTSLVIAHRLSTVRQADRIFALRNGEIVESGTHDRLMALRGYYWDLYQNEDLESETPTPGDELALQGAAAGEESIANAEIAE